VIILDTNVLSELMRLRPERVVFDWVARQPAASLYSSTITQAEILYGLARMPTGRRRNDLLTQYRAMMAEDFAGRLLPFDEPAAEAYGPLMASQQRAGRSVAAHDVQIASIALSRGAAVATRNITHFQGCGVELINPWVAPT
jgi:toxin FitB